MNGFNLAPDGVNNQPMQPHRRFLSSSTLVKTTFFGTTSVNVVPENVQALGYTQSFIENMNIMLLILIAEFIISLILMFVAWKLPFLNRISQFLIK
jgi:hypothetical protein